MKSKTNADVIEQLLKKLPSYYSPFDKDTIQRAYEVALTAHDGQTRASGEPYIHHCVAVAIILAEMNMPVDVVSAGLLHDTVEDTPLTIQDIRNQFGETTAQLVDGVTKLDKLPRVSRSDLTPEDDLEDDEKATPEQQSIKKQKLAIEALRKTFLAMNDDIRVVLIKLADRLHNIRTLGFTKPAKQRRIAQETLDIFAPLANRLGIWQMKWELEDLAFRYVNPEKYREIAEQISERRSVREAQIEQISARLQDLLNQAGIKAEVTGRPKHIYSIYKKMEKKHKDFNGVNDIRAMRVFVNDIPACYSALGIIHTHWRPIPGEFDDYIASPKDNFYQSLHTAVRYDDGFPLEVQIRTHEMHNNAEFGIAAHWRYKEDTKQDQKYEKHIQWLRSLMEWRQEVEDAQEFVESMKSDVFQDRVYVFTPRGDIIDLPGGSTPIDFAYRVHTDIGHRCRGAKVEGKLVSLDYALKTGESVQILTTKQGGPSRDWLNDSLGLVKTQSARSKIKVWFKKQDREQNLTQGRELLEKEFQRLAAGEINLENLARSLNFKHPEDLFVAIGTGDIAISKVVSMISEEELPLDEIVPSAPKSTTTATDAVAVVGLKGILTTISKCCNPTPGDPIIGYITRGRGASIHRQDCPNMLRHKERDRMVQLSWGEAIRTYPVPIRVIAFDRQGLMGDISTLLNSENINIIDVGVKVKQDSAKADIANIRIEIEIRNIVQLSRILKRIENLPNVLEAQRFKAG